MQDANQEEIGEQKTLHAHVEVSTTVSRASSGSFDGFIEQQGDHRVTSERVATVQLVPVQDETVQADSPTDGGLNAMSSKQVMARDHESAPSVSSSLLARTSTGYTIIGAGSRHTIITDSPGPAMFIFAHLPPLIVVLLIVLL
eukprot:gnl/TRDRNA2_/TRDRNA2_42798_c0_seq1.p1 gnl/TRDRNA2_/TRDRNA2_42798_c0~~gnl/TRDRNA2_/TRDRNA2_42798_c0_seq1.p1  ORF type:complete len:143 (-),score=18.41 gnl/TRDRNA2_/TRDRNA2_42798_c0_seq1:396-824(-)